MNRRYLRYDANIYLHPAFGRTKNSKHKVFERVGVFLHMLQDANFKPSIWEHEGEHYHIKRGQLPRSVTTLCKAYGFTRSEMRGFLKQLEKWKVISRDTSAGFTLITFNNYDEWQGKLAEMKNKPPPDVKPPVTEEETETEQPPNENKQNENSKPNNAKRFTAVGSTTLAQRFPSCTTAEEFWQHIFQYEPEWQQIAKNKFGTDIERIAYELTRFFNYYTEEQPTQNAKWANKWRNWSPDRTYGQEQGNGSGTSTHDRVSNAVRSAL